VKVCPNLWAFTEPSQPSQPSNLPNAPSSPWRCGKCPVLKSVKAVLPNGLTSSLDSLDKHHINIYIHINK
jgi:hypothetical protein